MKLKLHHVNLCTTNVPAMDAFYRDVLDMQTDPSMGTQRVKGEGYPGDVSFVTDGDMQDKVLSNAPDAREGFFAVPKVVE